MFVLLIETNRKYDVNYDKNYKQPNLKKISQDAIKVWLPEVQQKTHFSCGAAVVHSICSYYGLGLNSHYDYFSVLETDETYGTPPIKIVNYFKYVGLNCRMISNMSIESLCQELQKKKPVVLVLQAYGNSKNYKKSGSGHYVVAIGYDKINIIFEDPYMNCSRGYIPKNELINRWHDIDYKGIKYQQTGIVAWKNQKPFYLNCAKKIP